MFKKILLVLLGIILGTATTVGAATSVFNSNQVGGGTPTSGFILQSQGANTPAQWVVNSSGGGSGGGWIAGTGILYNATSTDLVGIGSTSPTATLSVRGKPGANPFVVASSTNTQLFSILSNGNTVVNYALSVGTTTGNIVIGNTDGNTRGSNALDIQSYRSAVTKVAAGLDSTTIGQDNRAVGDFTQIFGNGNAGLVGSGQFLAGINNTANNSSDIAVGIGNTVTGISASVFGNGNTVNGGGAYVFGAGITNTTANSLMIGPNNTYKITMLGTGELYLPGNDVHSAGNNYLNNLFVGNVAVIGSTYHAGVFDMNVAGSNVGIYFDSTGGQNLDDTVIHGYSIGGGTSDIVFAPNNALVSLTDFNIKSSNDQLLFHADATTHYSQITAWNNSGNTNETFKLAASQLEIGSGNVGSFTNNVAYFDPSTAKFPYLAGTGTRTVGADSTGKLVTMAGVAPTFTTNTQLYTSDGYKLFYFQTDYIGFGGGQVTFNSANTTADGGGAFSFQTQDANQLFLLNADGSFNLAGSGTFDGSRMDFASSEFHFNELGVNGMHLVTTGTGDVDFYLGSMDAVDGTNLHFIATNSGSPFESFELGFDGHIYMPALPTSAGGPTGSLYQLAGVVMVN